MTHELIAELADSPAVRVLPYDRELQIVRPFRGAGRDISSREALQALIAQSGARLVIAPTLLYENGSWQGRVEIRDAVTGTNAAVRNTAPVVSSLIKETAHRIDAVARCCSRRLYRRDGTAARGARTPLVEVRRPRRAATRAADAFLDAAALFSQGIEAHDALEYDAALRAFTMAAEQDSRNALILAWRGRVAGIMRHDRDAADATAQAFRLVADQPDNSARLFVEAVAAELRRDQATATARYTALTTRHPDDIAAIIELAATTIVSCGTTTRLRAITSRSRSIHTSCGHISNCAASTTAPARPRRPGIMRSGRLPPTRPPAIAPARRRRGCASPTPCAWAARPSAKKPGEARRWRSRSSRICACRITRRERGTTPRWRPKRRGI